MERQTYWERVLKPLFPKESLELLVETKRGRVREVNLDNAATTIPFTAVMDAAKAFLTTYGSVHRGSGHRSVLSTDAYEQSRKSIRDFVGASPKNYVVFTRNTTEAINHAAKLWEAKPGKVLVSDIEHSSNLLPWLNGNEVVQYETTAQGFVEMDNMETALKEGGIKLLTVTGSSNVTGYRPPIHDLAVLAHRYGAKILVDGCQLVQHHKVWMLPDDDPGHIDFVAFSGHKMHAPFGAGVLIGPKQFFDESEPYQIGGGNLTYITRDLQLKRPLIVQAHDPGTPNALGAVTMAVAAKVLNLEIGYERIKQYETWLAESAFDRLAAIPGVNMYVDRNHLGSVITFDVDGLPAHQVAERLREDYGIGVRAGSFCTYELLRKLKGISDDEPIVQAIDRGDTSLIPSVVRASFGLVNQPEDVERFTQAVYEISKTNT